MPIRMVIYRRFISGDNRFRAHSKKVHMLKLDFFGEEPKPDKPEIIATKAPRHKEKMFIIIELCALASWWSAAGGLDKSFANMM